MSPRTVLEARSVGSRKHRVGLGWQRGRGPREGEDGEEGGVIHGDRPMGKRISTERRERNEDVVAVQGRDRFFAKRGNQAILYIGGTAAEACIHQGKGKKRSGELKIRTLLSSGIGQ